MTELVVERVEKSQGRMSGKRMLPIARAAGYEGSDRNFRQLVADAKMLGAMTIIVVVARRCGHRGEYLVIDWAHAAPGLFLFCAVLSFSRWRFIAFATDQKSSTTLALASIFREGRVVTGV